MKALRLCATLSDIPRRRADVMTSQVAERRVDLDLVQPCWPWEGYIQPHGYAKVMIDGDMKYVHRLSYQLHVGPIQKGWEVDHGCHSEAVSRGECADPEGSACAHRSCWNPAHLEAVSSRENSMRGNHPLFKVRRSTICRRGLHKLEGPNLMTKANGTRRCRECARERVRESRTRKKAVSKP